MFKRALTISALAAAASAVPLELSPATPADSASLHVSIPWSGQDSPCPADYAATTTCHPHPGGPVAVPGLGFVSQSYVFAVDLSPSGCPAGTQRALSYPAQLVVKGRGTISLSVAASTVCAAEGVPLVSVAQAFTITGGTGVFAGSSGSGVVSRTHVTCCSAAGTDNWNGTLTAPAFHPDLTPPTIKGAHNRLVPAPRGVKRLRVKYKVTAVDVIDGTLRPTCRPRSGSRFRVGSRTRVRCSATDRSANARHATFSIAVRGNPKSAG
jgi:HYR domain-containing protein